MNPSVSYDRLVEKWSPVLNEESAGEIKDIHRTRSNCCYS
jgi:hypothetical protein